MFDPKEIRGPILGLVIGVILVIVGAVAGMITGGIGYTIIGTLNKSNGVTIPSNINYLGSVSGILSPVFTILGIALLVAAVVWIIYLMLRSFQSAGSGALS